MVKSRVKVAAAIALAVAAVCSPVRAQSVMTQPAHWDSRLGTISMQYSGAVAQLTGAFEPVGDSLQEQRPQASYGYPLMNMPGTVKYGVTNTLGLNTTFSLGFMGIGIYDFVHYAVAALNSTSPGRVAVSEGTNDVLIGSDGVHSDNNNSQFFATYTADINVVISTAIARTGDSAYVIVETIPDALDGHHDNQMIATLNRILLSMTSQYAHINVYDFNARLKQLRPGSQVYAADNVHLGRDAISLRAFDEQSIFTGQPLGALN